MTLEEKDRYIEEKLMLLEPDTLRYMVVDFMAALEETTTLRDQFAMAALTGLQSQEDDRMYTQRHIHNPEYSALSLDEWRSLIRKQDAELCYAVADAMFEARAEVDRLDGLLDKATHDYFCDMNRRLSEARQEAARECYQMVCTDTYAFGVKRLAEAIKAKFKLEG